MHPNILDFCRSIAPRAVGKSPRLLLAASVAFIACNSGGGTQQTPPVALGMTSTMAPSYSDGRTTMYTVQVPVQLPVRAPVGKEVGQPPIAGTPYPNAPFLTAEMEQVEIHYTISNIDDTEHAVWLLIYPWNEFVRWKPGIAIVNMENAVPNYGYDQYLTVPGKSRLEGTITNDDTHEISIKLASVENMLGQLAPPPPMGGMGMPMQPMMNGGQDPTTLANHIMNPFNRSNGNDPLYTPWIPPVIAGLTGFDLGLRTQSGEGDSGGGANLAIEITMDVVDVNGDRIVQQGSNTKQIGMPPMTLSPPGAM